MIYGNGIDLISINRIESTYNKFSDAFVNKILSLKEKDIFYNNPNYSNRNWQARFLAKRFVAKEAVAKAFGTGIGKYFTFKDIEIINNKQGKPIIIIENSKISNFTQQFLELNLKNNQLLIHISISDEVKGREHFAIASAIIELFL